MQSVAKTPRDWTGIYHDQEHARALDRMMGGMGLEEPTPHDGRGIRLPAPGYNLALLERGRLDSDAMLAMLRKGEGLPVLAEAEGAQGVLNALQIRMGRIVLDEPHYTLAHLRIEPDRKTARLAVYNLDREEAPPRPQTYASAHRWDHERHAMQPPSND